MKNSILALLLLMACASGGVNIAAIAANPGKFDGDTVTMRVKFIGWGATDKPLYGTATTRSDWVVADETGACHVFGQSPLSVTDEADRGKELDLSVVVHVQDTSFWLEMVRWALGEQ